jgi:diguanylate cyclase (GGDEF)-like protein
MSVPSVQSSEQLLALSSAADLRSRFIALMDLLSALRRLLAASDTISTESNLIQSALSELATHMHLGACSVFLRNGDVLTCVAGTGFAEVLSCVLGRAQSIPESSPDSSQFQIGEGIMGQACLTGTPQSSLDCRKDPRFKALDTTGVSQKIGSLISIPLSENGVVFGVLNVSHPKAQFFDGWHQNALYLFADSLAQLLRNFRLMQRMDSEVDVRTNALQQALVEAEKLRARFEQLAVVDELTGLHNRRHFFSEAPRIVAGAQRDDLPLTLVIADLDEFKKVNDTWGHTYGDTVLVRAGEVLETELRAGDLLARLGGEEFAFILPNTDTEGARRLAGRINNRFPILPARSESSPAKLTASFGIAALTAQMAELPPIDALGLLYARADEAMYKCKMTGSSAAEVYDDNME